MEISRCSLALANGGGRSVKGGFRGNRCSAFVQLLLTNRKPWDTRVVAVCIDPKGLVALGILVLDGSKKHAQLGVGIDNAVGIIDSRDRPRTMHAIIFV